MKDLSTLKTRALVAQDREAKDRAELARLSAKYKGTS